MPVTLLSLLMSALVALGVLYLGLTEAQADKFNRCLGMLVHNPLEEK